MERYSKLIQVRWSDIDQNRHLRHSVYYDLGAMIRIEFLALQGLTTSKMESLKIGPILFREEAIFRKEIRMEDKVEIDFELVKATPDFARFTFRHNFTKEDGTLAATVVTDGAWIDIQKRRLTSPGCEVMDVCSLIPKSPDFRLIERPVLELV